MFDLDDDKAFDMYWKIVDLYHEKDREESFDVFIEKMIVHYREEMK